MKTHLKPSQLVIFTMTALFFLTLMGCPNPTDNAKKSPLAKMDIVNATTLFIGNGTMGRNARVAGDSGQRLFKITDEGFIQEVTYYDEEGNETTVNDMPTFIYNVDTEYTIVCFGGTPDNYGGYRDYTEGYLVRKSDGAVFSLSNVGYPAGYEQQSVKIGLKIIQQDKNGNIYYIPVAPGASMGELMKINVENPANLTATRALDYGSVGRSWYIMPDGHIVHDWQIKKATGGLYNLPSNFIVINDSIVCFTGSNTMHTITIDANGEVSDTTVELADHVPSFSIYGNYYLFKFSDKTIFANADVSAYLTVYEFIGSNVPTKVDFFPNGVQRMFQSDSYYYLQGADSSNLGFVTKVSASDHTPVPLISPGEYTNLSVLSVSSDDVVMFHAIRMSDGAWVQEQISADGTITPLSEYFGDIQVITLERIN
jgi:hypothetical protein